MLKLPLSLTKLPSAQQDRIVAAVNLTLVALFSYQLAIFTWRVMPAPDRPSAPAIPASAGLDGGTAMTTPATSSWDIANWHLFGQAPAADAIAAPVPVALPETRLNLVLRGLVSADTPKAGGAIISADNRTENYYVAGSALPGGATLESIHKDHVVIRRGQARELLSLPKDQLNGNTGTASIASQINRLPTGSGVPMRQIRNQLLQNPQTFSDFISIRPHTEHGRFTGYSLAPGRKPALFAGTGLRPGDIVTSVNGILLDRPDKALNALRGLSAARQASLTIKRNNQIQSIVLDFNR